MKGAWNLRVPKNQSRKTLRGAHFNENKLIIQITETKPDSLDFWINMANVPITSSDIP